MEKYTVPVAPIEQNPKPTTRLRWQRSLIELTGKFDPNYCHNTSALLMQSYSEIGAFPHSYHIDGLSCRTHVNCTTNFGYTTDIFGSKPSGVTALEFDTKGIYLASVTKSGCLTVHDFESLYCQTSESGQYPKEDEAKHLLHVSLDDRLGVVRWNLANQDEVACTSLSNNEVHIFDLGYVSSKPITILKKRSTVSIHGFAVRKGFSDVAFLSDDESRVFASDTCGSINIWDRRVSDLPLTRLMTHANSSLNSIQLNEDQTVYAASRSGIIYVWDLRGGRSSAAFQSHNEVHSSPLISVKLASVLDKIMLLKAQSNIIPKDIHSIGFNPSCAYQLGFHLDDGWSGVLDVRNFHVTHIHCPPPAWLDDTSYAANPSSLRKPSWLPTHSMYAVGSTSSNGLYLLDFYPHLTSPCHVDHDDSPSPKEAVGHKQNKLIALSESITACAAHPRNGTVVAGTQQSSLLMVSQRRLSCQKGDDGDDGCCCTL